MMNIFLNRLCMACCCIAVTSTPSAQETDTSAAEKNAASACSPQPDKSNVSSVPDCINKLFKQYSEESDSKKLNASYILGVRFQREIAGIYEDIDYARFLLGAMEQADKTMRFTDTELDSILNSFLLSKAEQSDKYVRTFAAGSNVEGFKGIYYIDRTGNNEIDEASCNDSDGNLKDYDYAVEFVRLSFEQELDDVETPLTCLHVNEDEIIRGWRTALRKMSVGNEWELLVPAPLAYGNDGTTYNGGVDKVEKGEALRFFIRLRNKS